MLLVCYSAPLPMKRHLAVSYRKRCPEGKIIAVSNQHVEKLEIADSFVYGIDGPEVLIDAIRGNIQRKSNPVRAPVSCCEVGACLVPGS